MEKSLPACGMFSGKMFRCLILSFSAALFSASSFAQLNYTQDTSNGCAPLTVNFTNSSSPPANYFRWTFSGGDTSNAVNPSYIYAAPGNYNTYLEGWDTTGGGMVYLGQFNGPQILVGGSSGSFYFSTGNTACANEIISFYTYNQFNSLKWDFGDSSQQQYWNWPQHSFSDTGVYNVTLYINTPCDTDTIIQSITITNTSVPYFNIQSNQNPVCLNDEVFFSIQNNYQAASYNWDFGDGFFSTLYQPSHVFSDTGNYSCILTATNICGNQNSDTMMVNVQPGVFPSSAVNYGWNPTCPYTAVSFQAKASGISFDWDFGDNATDSVRSTQHFYTDTGNYPVELVIENGCGISDTFNVNVTVQYNPGNQPNAQINVEGFWGQDTITICTGETVEFRNSSWDNNNGPLTYQWNFGDATSSSLKNVSHVYAGADTFNVEMIASNTCGGNDTAYLWIIVSNSALPDFNPQIFPPSEMGICPGEMVIFTDGQNKSIEESGYSYDIWFGDGDSLMNITSYAYPDCECMAVHFYQDTGTFIYTFKVTNICGISDSVSDTVFISNPLPAFMPFADNSAKPDSMWDNSVCPGDTVRFIAFSGVSFFWDFGDGQTDTAQFANHVYGAPGTYNAYVIVNNACGQTDTAYTIAEVKMTNTPDAWFETDKTLVSPGDTINFSYNSDDGDATVNVNWDFGDGASVSANNTVHAYSLPGLFQITMTASNGCGSSSNTQNITVVAPVADFSFAFSNNGCTPEMIQFTNLSLYADSFKWNFGDFSPEEFFEDPSHGYGWASTFFVTLTAYNFLTGDSDVITKPIIVNQTPMPGWAWFWPDPNPVCPNSEVEFNSFMFPSPTSVKWYFGDGDSSSLFIVSHTYADTGNFNVTYIAYNSCGSDTDIQIVDVDSAATITASSGANPNPACPAQQVDFTNWTWPAPVSSFWYFGDGDSATSFNASHAYADTGTYTATLIVYSSCNSDTATINVIIDTSIVPSVFAMVNTDTACINDPIGFSAFGNNLVSFNWDFDDGFSSLQQNPSHSFASNGTYDVIFIGTNSCGNSDTDIVTVAIINNAPPEASFSSSPFSACPGFSNICPGTNVYFTNGSINSTNNEWDFGDGFTSAETEPVHAYSDTGNYDVRLIATSSCGGKDTVIQCVRITDNAAPSAFFCYNPFCFSTPVCFGTEVTFINFSSDTANSFWDFGDGYTSTEANPKHIFADTGNYTVTLQVTNSCGNTAYTFNSINVTNTVPPSANFFTSPNPACPGEIVNFNVFSMSAAEFFWDFGDGDTITSSAVFMTHAFDTTGNYDVTMVAFNNCGSDTSIYSVNIKPGTLADFSFDTVCFGDTTHFMDTSSPTPGNWAWDFGDGNTATVQNPPHLFLSPGIYLSSLTATLDGCVGSISKSVNVVEINLTISGIDNSCNGSCDGMANVSSPGGIEPYSFIWSNGQTDSTATGLCAGNYSVTVTDFSGCSDTISVTIDEPTAISYGSVVAGLICFGTTDGSIDLLPGSAFYSYNWSNGATTEDISPLSGATYYVTVTDTNSCTDTASFLIEETTSFSIGTSMTPITCFGYNNGTAEVYPAGTTTPFIYLWSDGSTTAAIDSLPPASYSVSVTDSNGCELSFSQIDISEPPALTSAVVSSGTTCNSICNGNAEVNPSGGTQPYVFIWTNSQTDSVATGLCAGTYYVTISDGYNCTAVDSAVISQPSALSVTASAIPATCNGTCNGVLTASGSGGTTGYTYFWSGGLGSGATKTSVCAGSYTVTVTDNNGCTSTSSTTVNQPVVLTSSAASTNASCNTVCDGTLTASGNGGTTIYSYFWSGGLGSGASKTGVCAGSYTVTVTDANGCTSTASATVGQPTLLTVTASANPATCGAVCDGLTSASASGGTSPYSFSWTNGDNNASADSLCPGNNDVTVTDNNGCTATGSAIVSGTTGMMVDLSSSADTTWASPNTQRNGLCCSASLPDKCIQFLVKLNPGTSGIVFNVCCPTPPGASFYQIGCGPLMALGEPVCVEGLSSLVITYCKAGGDAPQYSIIAIGAALLTSAVSGNDVTCNSACDGNSAVSALGGISPYAYSWSSGDNLSATDSLCQGNYFVTVSDSIGCFIVDSITITEPAPIIPLASVMNDVYCNGDSTGSAIVDANGGVSPYSYLWSNGQTDSIVTALSVGTYYVTISDYNGCTADDSLIITEPSAFGGSAIIDQNIVCYGNCNGSAVMNVFGGVSPYSYLWSNGQQMNATNLCAGTYSVTAMDSDGCTIISSVLFIQPTIVSGTVTITNVFCNGDSSGVASVSASGGTSPYFYNWSNGGMDSLQSNLSQGNYSVTVSEVFGCDTILSLTISEPTAIIITTTPTNPACGNSDGQITASASGGEGGFDYLWSDGQISATATGLSAGAFTLTVTDSTGCSEISTVNLSNSGAPVLSVVTTNVSCNGGNDGSVDLSVSGGTSPHSYLWSSGEIAEDLDSLTAGNYSVTVTDATFCIAVANETINEPAILSATVYSTGISCFGACDATVGAMVSGGISPYTYFWNDGSITQLMTGMCAGNYSVTVTDFNGCASMSSVTISEPSLLVVSSTGNDVSCNGGSDGDAAAAAGGGISPYAFLWSTGATTSSVSGLPSSVYYVTATDANGCTDVDSITIGEPTALSASASSTDASCNGGNNGSASVTVNGGTSPYSYLWANGATTSSISGLPSSAYSVTATDSNGCTVNSSATVNEPAAIIISTSVVNPACGASDGEISASVSGGTSPYFYLWNDSSNGTTISGLSAGSYSLTVTDSNGCVQTTTISLSNLGSPVLSSVVTEVLCNGGTNGAIDLTVSGGTTPYTFNWDNSEISEDLGNLLAGMYSVSVTDATSCIAVSNETVTEPDAVSIAFSLVDASCSGTCNGSISSIVSGGTSPYNYTWSNGDNSVNADSLCAGNYFVTVSDVNGCSADDSTAISEPTTITVSVSITDISCNGACDGSVSVNATGGTSPYSFAGAGTNLCAGDYPVTVSDSNGCSVSDSATILEPAPLILVVAGVDVSCNGSTDGVLIATVSGGTSPYSYLWSNALMVCCPVGISAGTYSVTVIDSNGCIAVDSTTISEPAAIILTTTSTNTNCGGNNGAATANANGGSGFFTYLWDDTNAQTTATATGLAAGNYSVTVTDGNGCSDTAIVSVSVSGGLFIFTSITGISCSGTCDGSVTVNVSGGFPPFTYLWSDGQTGITATGLCAGNILVTVTDSTGCSAVATVTLSQQIPISLSLTATPDSGSANGTSTVTASGGTPPYSYLWDPAAAGQTDSTATGLSSGYHSVSVTDANSCTEVDSIEVPLLIGVSRISHPTSHILIYPNPVRNELNLKLSISSSEMVRITLINALGQETQLLNEKIDKGDKVLIFDTEKFSTGVYYFQISIGENNPEHLRFVKAR